MACHQHSFFCSSLFEIVPQGEELTMEQKGLLSALGLPRGVSYIAHREACLALGQRMQLLYGDMLKFSQRSEDLQQRCQQHLTLLEKGLKQAEAAIRANFMPEFGSGPVAWARKHYWISCVLAKRDQVIARARRRVRHRAAASTDQDCHL
jgi:hypothetical protein